MKVPAGAAGSGDWKTIRGLMREKFVACATPVVGAEHAVEAADRIERLEELDAREVKRLIELNVSG